MGVVLLFIRKLISALLSCVSVIIIYSFLEQSGFVILFGMYLLPILLFYGLPSSMLSDFVTKRIKGIFRGFLAFFIHVFLAVSFVLFSILFFDWERAILFLDPTNLLNNFFLTSALLSSSLFWCFDEILRCKKVINNWHALKRDSPLK